MKILKNLIDQHLNFVLWTTTLKNYGSLFGNVLSITQEAIESLKRYRGIIKGKIIVLQIKDKTYGLDRRSFGSI